ncbi:MAG: hypothetical protein Faunusvirus15_6 [Faunusvirus sp.]|jgi:hypothetical protein|uniref:Uncharacterized protein n=1 Tax=Faunusvirus sp. TaxID=2487766 RepID=A0A3G4ZX38_9VIRU|nr:MAG: hypothetical protein Faunusvirus15_6 [Faunusvirus sp.]
MSSIVDELLKLIPKSEFKSNELMILFETIDYVITNTSVLNEFTDDVSTYCVVLDKKKNELFVMLKFLDQYYSEKVPLGKIKNIENVEATIFAPEMLENGSVALKNAKARIILSEITNSTETATIDMYMTIRSLTVTFQQKILLLLNFKDFISKYNRTNLLPTINRIDEMLKDMTLNKKSVYITLNFEKLSDLEKSFVHGYVLTKDDIITLNLSSSKFIKQYCKELKRSNGNIIIYNGVANEKLCRYNLHENLNSCGIEHDMHNGQLIVYQ